MFETHKVLRDKLDILKATLQLIREQYSIIYKLWEKYPTIPINNKNRIKLIDWEYNILVQVNALEIKLGITLTDVMPLYGVYNIPNKETGDKEHA